MIDLNDINNSETKQHLIAMIRVTEKALNDLKFCLQTNSSDIEVMRKLRGVIQTTDMINGSCRGISEKFDNEIGIK